MSNHKVQWVLAGLLQCKCLAWLSTAHLCVPEEPVHKDADSSLSPEGFPGTQTPYLQGGVSNTWTSSKKCGEGAGLSGSKHSTGRQWELHLQERAEDLWWRQTALPECLQPFHSHASPASFLCEHALDPALFAFSFSKLQIQPTFALVNTGQKGRKEAWLPSALVLRRPLLLFFFFLN